MPHRRPQPRRTNAAGAAAVAVALLLGGCELPRFGQPDPSTEQGAHTLHLWQGFVLAGFAVMALVLGLIAYAAVRFRRRGDDDGIPDQKPYNVPWEVAYTAIPILVVIVLFGFSVATQTKTDRKVRDPDLVVDVTGFQWGWQFAYPDRHVTISGSGSAGEKPTLVLPEGRTTRLVLHTVDVIHSFWVPSFLVKRDLIQGVDNSLDVTPDKVGTYDGRCAEYCALDHWRMTFTLEVVPPDQLDAAIARAAAATKGGPP